MPSRCGGTSVWGSRAERALAVAAIGARAVMPSALGSSPHGETRRHVVRILSGSVNGSAVTRVRARSYGRQAQRGALAAVLGAGSLAPATNEYVTRWRTAS